MQLPEVVLYTKPGCCLCDEAKQVLLRVRADLPFALDEVDISGDPELSARFGSEIPVVLVDGRKAFKYHVDERSLRLRLSRRAGAAV